MGEGINVVGVLLAAVANMVVAAIWYSPALFGKTWMASVGSTEEAVQAAAPRAYVLAGLASLVAAFTIASSFSAFGLAGGLAGMWLGLEYGIGLVAMYVLSIMAFEARPMRLILIDCGFAALGLAAVGTVIGFL